MWWGDLLKFGLGTPAAGTAWNLGLGLLGSHNWDQWYKGEKLDERNFGDHINRIDTNNRNLVGGVVGGINRAANDAFSPTAIGNRWNTAFGGLGDEYGAIPGQLERANSSVLGQFDQRGQGVLSDVQKLGAELSSGYDDRYQRARGMVEEISSQDRTDANRRFDDTSASESAGLASRGFGNSTVGASIRSGVEGDRGDELRRLSDQGLREQLFVEDTFGGAGLLARERTGLAGAELGANLAGQSLQGGLNAAGNLATTQLAAITGRADLAGRQFDAQTSADIARLNTMVQTGQMTIAQASQQIDHLLALHEQRIVSPPQMPSIGTIQS